MRPCCPAGHGCNAPDGDEPCALDLCRGAAGTERDAALALKRWTALQQAREKGRTDNERRFRRRAFERARDRALIALAMGSPGDGGSASSGTGRSRWRGRRRRAHEPDRPVRQ